MKSLRLLPGLAAALALLAVLALAPPVAADVPSAADSVTGVTSVNALLDEAAAATGGVDGARVSVSGGVTVDPSAFPATRLASNETYRTGWDLAADASQVGNPGVDNGIVYALATAADGTVYVGGSFTSAGGNASIQYIGKWRRNTGWAALGTFTAGTVRAITIGSDGKVYAGGDFSDVKMWNGSAWSTVGSAVFSGGSVRALAFGLERRASTRAAISPRPRPGLPATAAARGRPSAAASTTTMRTSTRCSLWAATSTSAARS